MISTTLANKLTPIAKKQLTAGNNFKRPRLTEIQKSLDLYNNKTKPTLRGRYNVPIPVMGGFVDTLKADIDDPIQADITGQTDADVRKARKIEAAFKLDTNENNGDWNTHDLDVKTMAIFSGRGIAKIYAESDPKYRAVYDPVDYIDFVCQPGGGAYLKPHLYHGQQNIIRTRADLEAGAKSKIYDGGQVKKLLATASGEDSKSVGEEQEAKEERYRSMDLDIQSNDYVGQQLYSMVEWIMVWEGKQYYLFFEPNSGVWVRAELLKDVFAMNETPFTSWATHRDPVNFWSKGPCDDMRPTAESIHIIFNQILTNINKRNWGARAFDKAMFKDPSKLLFKQDGLVDVEVPPGKSIQDGYLQFETPEINTSVNLIGWLDSFTGQKVASTPGQQGQAEREKKVGIYFGDLQRIQNRLGVVNKSYRKAQAEDVMRYIWGSKEHMPAKRMVRILGEGGMEDSEMTKEDMNPTVDIAIKSSQADLEIIQRTKDSKAAALSDVMNNPVTVQHISGKWGAEERLIAGGYEANEVKRGMDKQNEGAEESILMAAEENEKFANGEIEPLNAKATMAHLQRHKDFMETLTNEIAEAKGKKKQKIVDNLTNLSRHFLGEFPIAIQNTQRQLQNILAQNALRGRAETPPPAPGEGEPASAEEVAVPSPVAGNIKKTQQITAVLAP